MSTFEYTPKGVCSRKMIFELNGDTIESVSVIGGCNGNLKGIASLLKGQKVDEIIERLHYLKYLNSIIDLYYLKDKIQVEIQKYFYFSCGFGT